MDARHAGPHPTWAPEPADTDTLVRKDGKKLARIGTPGLGQ